MLNNRVVDLDSFQELSLFSAKYIYAKLTAAKHKLTLCKSTKSIYRYLLQI